MTAHSHKENNILKQYAQYIFTEEIHVKHYEEIEILLRRLRNSK